MGAPDVPWTATQPVHPAECGVPKCHQKSHNCGACLEGNVDAWNAPLICLWPHNGTVELLLEGLIAACEAGALPLKEGPIKVTSAAGLWAARAAA